MKLSTFNFHHFYTKDKILYEQWKNNNHGRSLANILKEFVSLRLDCHFLLTQLPKLKPRFYSISSSPNVSNDIQLTIGLVVNNQEEKESCYGVCTKWLADLPDGSLIPASIRK